MSCSTYMRKCGCSNHSRDTKCICAPNNWKQVMMSMVLLVSNMENKSTWCKKKKRSCYFPFVSLREWTVVEIRRAKKSDYAVLKYTGGEIASYLVARVTWPKHGGCLKGKEKRNRSVAYYRWNNFINHCCNKKSQFKMASLRILVMIYFKVNKELFFIWVNTKQKIDDIYSDILE